MLPSLFVTLCAALISTAQSQAPKEPRNDLTRLFRAVRSDDAQVVPLILAASAELALLDGEKANQLGDTLEPYCRRAFFSPERLPGMERLGLVLHTVREGELPGEIAAHYQVGAGMLAYLNKDYDERRVPIGQVLKVLDVSDDSLNVFVHKGRFRLATWRAVAPGTRACVCYVPVGLGAPQSPTPLGTTTITKRVRNPQWTHPVTKQVFEPDDPGNVLGGYWIALDAKGLGKSGIGLHGFTGAPAADWIAQPASNGCVRMLQGDIDRVFQLALEGTSVHIVP